MTGGLTEGFERVPAALAALRQRLLGLTDRLEADEWGRPSRCELWSVHDVVRHVRDGCRVHTAQLRSIGTSVLAPGFDNRTTPLQWLERSAGESPTETVDDLRALVTEEAVALEARMDPYRDETVMGPYGPAHWTVLTTHVLWDAWVHARDVTAALGWADDSTPGEDEVVALYALLIASVPAALTGHAFEAKVDLVGAGGRHHLATVVPAHVVLRRADAPAGDEQLRGPLAPVVDVLAGRGPEVQTVLTGDRAALEPLTWLRPILTRTTA